MDISACMIFVILSAKLFKNDCVGIIDISAGMIVDILSTKMIHDVTSGGDTITHENTEIKFGV